MSKRKPWRPKEAPCGHFPCRFLPACAYREKPVYSPATPAQLQQIDELAKVIRDLGEWERGFVSSMIEKKFLCAQGFEISERQAYSLAKIHALRFGELRKLLDGPREIDAGEGLAIRTPPTDNL